MTERKRAIQLKFYVTEQERILIEEKMKLLQTDNMGAYLRKMAIDGYIIQLDYSAIKEQTAEIQNYVWIKTPDGMTSWEFFDFLLNKYHIVGTPGSGFGPSGEGYFRLTAFNTRENTVKAMSRMAD